MEVTTNDIDTTVNGVEQEMSFTEPDERDKLLPLRELQGLDKEVRTIKGTSKAAIAKRFHLKVRIEHEERQLRKVQKPTYSDDQITMIENRIKDEEIDILKGEASEKINQIKESITNFLNKETGTLDERTRTLFKEQGITIDAILTAIGVAIGVLIEALLGGPTVSTSKSGNNSGGDRKDGEAGEWIKTN